MQNPESQNRGHPGTRCRHWGRGPDTAARLVAEGSVLGHYEFTKRKTGKDAKGEAKPEPLVHQIDRLIRLKNTPKSTLKNTRP
ncbi:MAG: hypothetical protein R2857_12335 [Vampirovibrionales bacterium]